MAVVAIVGILAVLAIVGFRKYLNYAHSSEAVNMVGAIKSAQEAYRAETLSYFNVSTNLKTYYPRQTPDAKKMGWGAGGTDADNWRRLNVTVDGPVMYVYACVAGGPAQAPPTADFETADKPTLPNSPVEPWYLIQAKGDINGDGTFGYAISGSFTGEVYRENEGE